MKTFKKIYIEITNVCNLTCAFCPKTKRPSGFMSQELFKKILAEIQGHGKFVYFHVLGEPLLHPELGQFFDICHEFQTKVNLTTNGTLIQKAGELLLSKPALRQVNFSLHSFYANEQGYSIEPYLDRIFDFIEEARKRTNLLICLRLWNLSDGTPTENNRIILDRIEKAFSLDYPIEEKLTPCRGIKLAENIFLNQAESFQWPNIGLPELADEKGFCYGLRDQVAILVDGTVVPCCLDGEGNIPLGNIENCSFSKIIESKQAQDMYNAFSNRKIIEPLCRTCGYRTRFN